MSNLASARWPGQGRIWAQACFFCQQAAETALKAILIAVGQRNLRTHSTVRLIKRALPYQPGLAAFVPETPLLDRHYVATRYPNGVADSSQAWQESDFCQAEKAAGAIVDPARQLIEEPSRGEE